MIMKKWLLTMGVLLRIAGGPAVAETWPLRINIWNVCPASYPSYQVHDNYFINIKQDSIDMSLPYMGRVYQLAYGSRDGLTFKAPLQNMEKNTDKKKRTTLRFTVDNEGIHYRFRIQLNEQGTARISLQPSNAQSIQYDGDIVGK